MISRSLNLNIANNQPHGLLGGGSVRSRSGTRYVLGLLSVVSRAQGLENSHFCAYNQYADSQDSGQLVLQEDECKHLKAKNDQRSG
jgi:hypothetical protein